MIFFSLVQVVPSYAYTGGGDVVVRGFLTSLAR
jgi:hypothetical protein